MPTGIYIRTKEHCKKISELHKGKKHTKATKNKISESHKKLNKKLSKIHKKVFSFKNKNHSEKTLKKMSKSRLRGLKNGKITVWNKGKKYSLEIRKKMSISQPKKEKNHNWKGGNSILNRTERQNLMRTVEYKFWREAVFKRDNWTCIKCKLKGGWSRKLKKRIILQADHIKTWTKFPELRFEVNNGQTLCKNCHLEKTKQDNKNVL